LLAGKAIALVVLLLLITIGPRLLDLAVNGQTTFAQATAPADPYAAVKLADQINALNTVWVLLGAFLVFGMQAGFTMLEAGFVARAKRSTCWSSACSTHACAEFSSTRGATRSCSAPAMDSSAGTIRMTQTSSGSSSMA
jgi:Amt family ammonium transporter